MPTYEYLCLECDIRHEVVQSFTDANLEMCETCGGKLRKIIFPVGIQFKGSGFYSTDRKASQPISRVKDKDKDKSDSRDKSESVKSEAGNSDSNNDSKQSASEKKSDSKSSESKSESSGKPKDKKVSEKTG